MGCLLLMIIVKMFSKGGKMDQVKIGKFISEARRKKNITQKEIAEKLGVTDKTVSRWENGHYLPDISLWKELCEILDISVLDLMNGEKKERNKEEMEESIFNTIRTTNTKVNSMKKKTIIIMLISILIIIGTIIGAIYVINNNKKQTYEPISFISRYASVEKDDGWVCYFEISNYQNDYNYYSYNCVNLKYKTLDDFYAIGTEMDKNGEMFEYRVKPIWVDYIWSNYEPDIRKISNYFQERNFKNTITIDDLKDLKLETDIDKTEVLDLYNKAVNSKRVLQFGKFMDFQPVNVLKSMNINGYEWTFGYNIFHGRIENVYLDCKYDNVWLKDIKEKTDYQKIILEDIPIIENYMLTNQTLELPEKFDKDIVYTHLIYMLNDIKK